jgi:hypothetical protein
MQPMEHDQRRDDPFYAHFEHLKSCLMDAIKGRRAGELLGIAESTSLFQFWSTDMRYAPTTDILDNWVQAWQESALSLVAKMDLSE